MKKDPRGIRNHNPGNIRHGAKWAGLAKEQPDKDFCTFEAPEWGLRALMKVLLTYYRKHKLETIADIIARWAPPVENDTKAYAAAVCRALGVTPDQKVSVDDPEFLSRLAAAIVRHENGKQPYSPACFWRAARMALT